MGDFTITSRALSQSIPATAQEKSSSATSSRMPLKEAFVKSTFLRPGGNIKRSTLRISALRALLWFTADPSRRSSTVGISGDKYVWHCQTQAAIDQVAVREVAVGAEVSRHTSSFNFHCSTSPCADL